MPFFFTEGPSLVTAIAPWHVARSPAAVRLPPHPFFVALPARALPARRFRFTYAGEQPEVAISVVLDKPKYGVPMRVQLRVAAPAAA